MRLDKLCKSKECPLSPLRSNLSPCLGVERYMRSHNRSIHSLFGSGRDFTKRFTARRIKYG
ncbi:hypothetical protein D3C84_1298370 [compost metagenome]